MIKVDIFKLMLHKNFVCGYIFTFCTTKESDTYTQMFTKDWIDQKLAAKPATDSTNDFLDKIYDASNPSSNPPTFKILWMTDLNLDANYACGSSRDCGDYSCCHANYPADHDMDQARKYGEKTCNMPLEGYKKMMAILNTLNATSEFSFTSMIYGGSTNAFLPEYTTLA